MCTIAKMKIEVYLFKAYRLSDHHVIINLSDDSYSIAKNKKICVPYCNSFT